MSSGTITQQAEAAANRQLPGLLTLRMIRDNFVPAGERTLMRWISNGQFPKADVAVGSKIRYWKLSTVQAWIDQHAAA